MKKKFMKINENNEETYEELHHVNFGLLNKFLLDVQRASFDVEWTILEKDKIRVGNPLLLFYIERDYEKEYLWKVSKNTAKQPLLDVYFKWDESMERIE